MAISSNSSEAGTDAGSEGDRAGTSGRTQASILELAIRQDVIGGRLAAGGKLRLKDLAERYAAGVIPLREALSRLCASGFIVAVDQKGFRVADLSAGDLLDITRVRQQIESQALRDAIDRDDPHWEAQVVAALHRLKRIPIALPGPGRHMNPEWEKAHSDYHAALVQGCGSPWLRRFSAQLRDQTARYRHLSLAISRPEYGRNVTIEHEAIADAVLAGDAEQACALLSGHYQATADLILTHMARSGAPLDDPAAGAAADGAGARMRRPASKPLSTPKPARRAMTRA